MEENAAIGMTDYKEAKKFFSGIGIRYFVISLVFLLVQVAGICLVNYISPDVLDNYYMLVAMLPAYVIVLPVLFGIFKNVEYEPIPVRKFSFGKLVSAFFICYAFMYVGNIVGTILNYVFSGIFHVEATNILQEFLDTGNVYQTIFVVVICGPIAEELLFRKVVIDRLHRYGEGLAIVVSALMFGLYHGNITQFVYATLVGLVFGYVYVKSGNIKYSMVLHMIINFIGSVLSQIVIEKSGYMDMAQELTQNPEGTEEIVMAHAGGLVIFFIWLVLVVAFLITGIVLFFINKKKLHFETGEISLEKGKRFSTVVLNYGAIMYIIFWLIMTVVSL